MRRSHPTKSDFRLIDIKPPSVDYESFYSLLAVNSQSSTASFATWDFVNDRAGTTILDYPTALLSQER